MNCSTRTLIAALAVACLPGGGPPALCAETKGESAPEALHLSAHIDALAEPLAAAGQLSGRLVVRVGGRPAIVRNYGEANRELNVPVTGETLFNVASVTKTMTVIALAGLLEDQTLSLQDPVSRWLPEIPRSEDITVEMLVRHQSGIPHRVTSPRDETTPRTAADMVELVAAADLDFEPGARRSYSSAGDSVLVRVMELASGMGYPELLQVHVFDPAGMSRSFHANSEGLLLGRASSYVVAPSGAIVNAPLKDLSFLVGAGSVWSTADELERLAFTIRRGGFGELVRSELVGEEGFRSNGLTSGFRAFVDWHRESDVTVAFTGNLVTGAADLLRQGIPKLVGGESVTAPSIPSMTPVEVSATTLERYEGRHTLRPGRELEVRAADGGLRIGEWVLIPIGPDTFVSPQDYATISFVCDAEGRPTGMEWTAGGSTSELPRSGPLED